MAEKGYRVARFEKEGNVYILPLSDVRFLPNRRKQSRDRQATSPTVH
jgi:hypothetical protein